MLIRKYITLVILSCAIPLQAMQQNQKSPPTSPKGRRSQDSNAKSPRREHRSPENRPTIIYDMRASQGPIMTDEDWFNKATDALAKALSDGQFVAFEEAVKNIESDDLKFKLFLYALSFNDERLNASLARIINTIRDEGTRETLNKLIRDSLGYGFGTIRLSTPLTPRSRTPARVVDPEQEQPQPAAAAASSSSSEQQQTQEDSSRLTQSGHRRRRSVRFSAADSRAQTEQQPAQPEEVRQIEIQHVESLIRIIDAIDDEQQNSTTEYSSRIQPARNNAPGQQNIAQEVQQPAAEPINPATPGPVNPAPANNEPAAAFPPVHIRQILRLRQEDNRRPGHTPPGSEIYRIQRRNSDTGTGQ